MGYKETMMSPSEFLAAGTLFLFAPVPVWHLTLHCALARWRKAPKLFYALCAMEWALFAPISYALARDSGDLFDPPELLKKVCLVVSLAGLATAVWSIRALTPRSFFLWTVLRPDASGGRRTATGPYRYLRHPAYVTIILTMTAGFLATGATVLLVATPAVSGVLLLVTSLEERELRIRGIRNTKGQDKRGRAGREGVVRFESSPRP